MGVGGRLLSVGRMSVHTSSYLQGSHPTWKSLKTWNFVIYLSRPGKCLEFAQKVGKS